MTTGVALYALLRAKVPELPASNWELYPLLLFAVLCWSLLTYSSGLETRLMPRLTIKGVSLERTTETVSPDTFDSPTEFDAIYLHVIVTNETPEQIDACSVTLLSATGNGKAAPFGNPIRLVSAMDHSNAVLVYPGVPQNFDLLHTSTRHGVLDLSPYVPKPNSLQSFFHAPGTYVLRVAVAGKSVPTVTKEIKVVWNGQWNQVTAELL
jgi:hypothetical protein